MTASAASAAPADSLANQLLGLLAARAGRKGVVEGFLHEVAAELGTSPSQLSRTLNTLRTRGRIELVRRGHGHNPTQLRVLDARPLAPPAPRKATLPDRLLDHLARLASNGVVEQPLVDVARELGVRPPSISRALGRLVDDGLARVEQVGTRNRPTRIELHPDTDTDDPNAIRDVIGLRDRSGRESGTARLARDVAGLREEVAALRAEVAELRGRRKR
jgi:DNA-binding MarR family transcriptional regulator